MTGLRYICILLLLFTPLWVLRAQNVLINEIHYNPSSTQGSDTDYEFIELYNVSGSSIDVSNYYFSGITYTFPAGTSIAAGAFFVVARNSSNYLGSVTWTSGTLTNSGETLTLHDGSGSVVDRVAYDNSSPWPTPPDGDGPTLELKNPSTDNNDGSNWTYSYHSGGTPGYTNQSIQLSGAAGWRFLSLPLQSKTYNDLLSGIWTQGFTGADKTTFKSNVYTYNTSWTSISNQSDIPSAGTGFLVYVFSDDNNDGTNEEFPKTITINGTEHSATVSVTTAQRDWNLLGNPFTHTIDADKLSLGGSGGGTNDNFKTSIYVWDNTSGAFKSYDASTNSGSLTDGLIEPFQGFFIQSKSSGTKFDFKSSAKAISSGIFYKTGILPQIFVESSVGPLTDLAFLNICLPSSNQSVGAYKLKPVDNRNRVLTTFFNADEPMEILNVTMLNTILSIPFDVFKIDKNWVMNSGQIDMEWTLKNIPRNFVIELMDNETGNIFDLRESGIISVKNNVVLQPRFSENNVGPIPYYRRPRFDLKITPNSRLETHTGPGKFILHPAYPNPFNAATIIEFELFTNGPVQMDIYNMMGQKVESLIDQILPSGKQTVQWKPINLSSGLYFCLLHSGTEIQTIKLVLIK